MATSNFTLTLWFNQTPQQVFQAITNVRGWWSEDMEGSTAETGDEFIYHYKDIHYCKVRLIEVIPDQKVVWLILNNYFSFTEDHTEWKNTKVCFEISEIDGKSQLRFTHMGLVPEYECYQVCQDGWNNFIKNSLYQLVTTGKGQPNPKEGGFNAEQVKKWKLQ
jgi:uncharacterized protein YndB with AHSA1/START domain